MQCGVGQAQLPPQVDEHFAPTRMRHPEADIRLGQAVSLEKGSERGKYVLLADPKNIFGFQNVAMIVSKKVLSREGPDFAKTINDVSAKLTIEAMQKMNAAVDIDKNSPAAVAKKFLEANALV